MYNIVYIESSKALLYLVFTFATHNTYSNTQISLMFLNQVRLWQCLYKYWFGHNKTKHCTKLIYLGTCHACGNTEKSEWSAVIHTLKCPREERRKHMYLYILINWNKTINYIEAIEAYTSFHVCAYLCLSPGNILNCFTTALLL